MGNNSSCKSEREFLCQYNAIYQVMYDQKHIRDFLLYLRQKLSENNHFSTIPQEKLFVCFQDDLENICLKLSLSDLDQATAIAIYDYLQYIIYSLGKMRNLKQAYDNYISILKTKLSLDKSKHCQQYKQLFERFLSKYEELKQIINLIEKLDLDTIKTCLKTCAKKYKIPLNDQTTSNQNQIFNKQNNDKCSMYYGRETCSTIHLNEVEQDDSWIEPF
ncbi:hypothetical protein TTHERM_00678390 (macronuclear) [Tetrahymena thermophila SB210]|uniref:Uncharacterized protein n=1 Tax=Tetrahymena thermophila (strain SB210) TaxID=312017 RepID=I7MJW8_TETTS|nr:hypothetical protein TTHERM_00678390 [Tetrahymena thermophila SB210]EAS07573.1 hypothetical protein TTHERM_00678390 [Tetrahymena thermophila SB210]|eukprot:XP_001027815.1 hypothetical protein TTHERM_00678390 [Tetrahymena thermophila SB210]